MLSDKIIERIKTLKESGKIVYMDSNNKYQTADIKEFLDSTPISMIDPELNEVNPIAIDILNEYIEANIGKSPIEEQSEGAVNQELDEQSNPDAEETGIKQKVEPVDAPRIDMFRLDKDRQVFVNELTKEEYPLSKEEKPIKWTLEVDAEGNEYFLDNETKEIYPYVNINGYDQMVDKANKYPELVNKVAKSEFLIHTLSDTNKEIEAKLNKANEELKRIRETNTNVESVDEIRAKAKEFMAKLNTEKAELVEEVSKYQKKCVELEEKCNALVLENDEIKQVNDDIRRANLELYNENQLQKANLDTMDISLNKANADIETLRSNIDVVEKKTEELQNENLKLEEKLKTLEKESQHKDDIILSLQADIDNYSNVMATIANSVNKAPEPKARTYHKDGMHLEGKGPIYI